MNFQKIKPGHSKSPIREDSKHQMTPLKTRRKTSRKDQSADVHTCSTPIQLQAGNQCNTFNSPSDSFLCSQDNCPDVIWDYTSPKLPKGSKKKEEMKVTVDEFLKSLSHDQAPACNTQNSNYIRLLEQWMAKQNTPVCVRRKPCRAVKDAKVRSRRVFEEIKQFTKSIEQDKDKIENNRKEGIDQTSLPKIENPDQSITSLDKKIFLEGDSNENDSTEELWGEADNSFMVKATQMEVSSSKYNVQNKNTDISSTISETEIDKTSSETKILNPIAGQSVENTFLNKAILDADQQAHFLLTQIMSSDWGSDIENDLENGFIMGDEDLSLIPDEILCGADNKTKKMCERTEKSIAEEKCDNKTFSNKLQGNNVIKRQDDVNRSPEITFGCSDSKLVTFETKNISEIELFNNFEEDSFCDESILCKPEVLSWIDEVEHKLSQSQKCTPQEIEKKKDEAIQRRKIRSQLKTQNL